MVFGFCLLYAVSAGILGFSRFLSWVGFTNPGWPTAPGAGFIGAHLALSPPEQPADRTNGRKPKVSPVRGTQF